MIDAEAVRMRTNISQAASAGQEFVMAPVDRQVLIEEARHRTQDDANTSNDNWSYPIAWYPEWMTEVNEALGKQAQAEQVVRMKQDASDLTAMRCTIGEISDSLHGTESKNFFSIQVLLPDEVNATRDKTPSIWSEPIHMTTGWVQKITEVLGLSLIHI